MLRYFCEEICRHVLSTLLAPSEVSEDLGDPASEQFIKTRGPTHQILCAVLPIQQLHVNIELFLAARVNKVCPCSIHPEPENLKSCLRAIVHPCSWEYPHHLADGETRFYILRVYECPFKLQGGKGQSLA